MSFALADDVSVDTEDAVNVLARIDYIIASLEKAGVPPTELQHFKKVVSLARATGAGIDDDNDTSENVIAEAVLEKLQQGVHGFAPVWKPRWIRLVPGELHVFESKARPEPGVGCLFSLPLSVQQTRVDPGNEALCKRLGREAIVMVGSTTAVGGTMRCVTLAAPDDLALERWTVCLQKAMSQEGFLSGASIFHASQIGDIMRLKELIAQGVSVNRANAYGCIPLHYAVKNAAECAAVVARGGDEINSDGAKIRAQDALRVVVFLMSRGADARAVNNVGETPLVMGARLTNRFPKARRLLLLILDSSKYEISGGTISVVPGNPQLGDVEEEGVADEPPNSQAAVRAGGVIFSPSRRNRRELKKKVIAHSRRPYTTAASGPSCGWVQGERCITALPHGNHEATVGGRNYRLAARFSSKRCLSREASHRAAPEKKRLQQAAQDPGDRGDRGPRAQTIGVMFRDMKMAKNSALLVSRRKRGRADAHLGSRPTTSLAQLVSSCRLKTATVRPATTDRGVPSRAWYQTLPGDCRRKLQTTLPVEARACRKNGQQVPRRQCAEGEKRGRRATSRRDGSPTVPDFEARRQISEWLRNTAGTVMVVPPADGGRFLGRHLVETSGFVATDQQSEVYKALRAIKGDSRGELISAERLRTALCRTGQALQPTEMDQLLKEADPGDTGYVSCARLSKLITSNRLAPLAKEQKYDRSSIGSASTEHKTTGTT